jgi:hypothetical protein
MTTRSSAAARALVEGLRTIITVTYAPLTGNVAQLDTTTAEWLLELDTGSPPEDHCWAMIDVLLVLSCGPQRAEFAHVRPRLRLVSSRP